METPEITELQTLRQVNAELTAKVQARTARITELEATNATLQTSLGTSQAALRQIEIDEPLQTLASAVSSTPELFLMEFARCGYSVEKHDGKLAVMKEGKPVDAEFSIGGLTTLLAKSDDPALKSFRHLMIGTRAQGGGTKGGTDGREIHIERQQETPKATKLSLGLR